MKELIDIQSELKAPKNQYNNFGKYSYRSAEDILEAVKPILKKNNCSLVISDDIVNIGDRFYVKAISTLSNSSGESVSVFAFAREEESKKGMDGAQVTGSASSYARKYALNGLFCIDDTKDSDATNQHGKEEPKKAIAPEPKTVNKELTEALTAINKCVDIASLEEVWNAYAGLWTNAAFVNAVKKAKEKYAVKK